MEVVQINPRCLLEHLRYTQPYFTNIPLQNCLRIAAECDTAALYLLDGYEHAKVVTAEAKETAKANRARSEPLGTAKAKFCGEEKYYMEEGQKSYLSDRNRLLLK